MNYAPEVTGVGVYTTDVAAALAARGHQLTVITGLPHYPEWRTREGYTDLPDNFVEYTNGIELRRIRHFVPAAPKLWSRIRMEASFARRLFKVNLSTYDVVVVTVPALFSAIATVFKTARSEAPPIILWAQDIYSSGASTVSGAGERVARVLKRVESFPYRRAQAVIAIHDRLAQVLSQTLGVDPKVVSVVRNWTHIKIDRAPDVTRSEDTSAIVVLHAGNMGKKQDLLNVVEAARYADRNNLPIHFKLVGDGNSRETVEVASRDVNRLSIHDSLPGDAFMVELLRADVLLVNEDGRLTDMAVPSKLTTYFASGRPIVAATNPHSATASEIEASGAGVVVPSGRPNELVDAILSIFDDSHTAHAYGAAGQAFAAKMLSRDSAIEAFEEVLYRTIVRCAL